MYNLKSIVVPAPTNVQYIPFGVETYFKEQLHNEPYHCCYSITKSMGRGLPMFPRMSVPSFVPRFRTKLHDFMGSVFPGSSATQTDVSGNVRKLPTGAENQAASGIQSTIQVSQSSAIPNTVFPYGAVYPNDFLIPWLLFT